MLGKNQRDNASKAKIKVKRCKAVIKVSSLKNKQEQWGRKRQKLEEYKGSYTLGNMSKALNKKSVNERLKEKYEMDMAEKDRALR